MAKPKYAVVLTFQGEFKIIETNKYPAIKTKGSSLHRCKQMFDLLSNNKEEPFNAT